VAEGVAYYDQRYFDWQRSLGEFGGWADLSKFQQHIRPTDAVVDFGCGGGYLLKRLRAGDRLGVEPNPAARAEAEAQGVATVESAADVPDGFADVVISNHALEHTLDPLGEVRTLRHKLKPGGLAVFVVPCEGVSRRWKPGDVNQHLFSWSPMCIGNLFAEAGFEVEYAEPLLHRWSRISRPAVRIGGRPLFDLTSRIHGYLRRSLSQAKVVARNPG
jgi:SAM-dependent methyltransferase